MDAPPAWTLLFTGLITGIAVGVFGCFLLYLSGRVPPLQAQPAVRAATAVVAEARALPPQSQPVSAPAESGAETDSGEAAEDSDSATPGLSFYDELPDYEVPIDVTPVPLEREIAVQKVVPQAQPANATNRLLQIGAFQQLSSAESQVGMLEELGVDASIRQATVNGGRILHLVQAGPFASSAELNQVRALLQRNDINSFPLDAR
ncbi:MAG: SPOR domain-containing protein [Gammaproteobacteria bacterium]|nr:SPOR domain-containing protein [Pseudomonadales bacterium]